MKSENIVSYIKSHPCYSHQIFNNWSKNNPSTDVIGALFHQIQSFCASTRPGMNLPEGLKSIGFDEESHLLQEIIESEDGHGPELSLMAGHILNKSSDKIIFSDLHDQDVIENELKVLSDKLLGSIPNYDLKTGLVIQTQKAIDIMKCRKYSDFENTFRNLGVTLALEMISHNHLIPGEKHCLVDSKIYGVSLNDPEMHYLLEHWGESGAEAHHEKNAFEMVDSVLTNETYELLLEGAKNFLDALNSMWDILDSALLSSGYKKTKPLAA